MASLRFVVEQVILSALRRGSEERYEIDEADVRRIALVIESLIDRRSVIGELRRVLQISAALRTELESPTAAEVLEQVLRENSAAVHLIALHLLKSGALDETRAFQAREGREEPLAAPRIDSQPIEEETVKLAEFLDPASSGRIRQPSRRRGEAHDRGSQRDQDSRETDRASRGGSRSRPAVW